MDYDGDGFADLISGSYDPGEFYMFRGKGAGEYAKRETLVDKSGTPLLLAPDQTHEIESFGSFITTVDWESDGDLDFILGGFGGELLLRLNEGTRTEPEYDIDNIAIQADGADMIVDGHHATPVVADWDADGRWDLLSGSENGGAYWWRNVGTKAEPRFEAARELVPPHEGIGYNEFLHVGAQPGPGIRSQISVVDYDLDGKLDLLVGDFCTTVSPRADLSEEERATVDAALAKLPALRARQSEMEARVDEAFRAWWDEQDIPVERQLEDDVQDLLRTKREELSEELGLSAASKAWGAVWKEGVAPFLAAPADPTFEGDMSTAHGFVWFYRRK